MQDMKAALGNASKPDITHVRRSFMVYIARACEYGSAKYERANYMRLAGNGGTKANFERFRGYLRSAVNHIGATLDAMEAHLANDPYLEDEEGMLAAMYAPDTDETPGAKVGASLLPHVAHGAAGLMMAVVQAVLYGALPEDPGQPWTTEIDYTSVDPDDEVEAQSMEVQDVQELAGVFRCQHGTKLGAYCEHCHARVAKSDD